MRARPLLIAAGILLAPAAARAQVPVSDSVTELNVIQSYAQSIKAWTLQYKQYAEEAATDLNTAQAYAQDVETFNSFVQDPSLGAALGLVQVAGLGNDLPVSPYQLMSAANGFGGQGGVNGALSALRAVSNLAGTNYQAMHVYACQAADQPCADLNARGNGIAGSMGVQQAAYQDYRAHQGIVQGLRDQLGGVTTPALRETITAQLQAEQVWTANMQGSAQAAAEQAALARQSMVQRVDERQRQSADELFNDTAPITDVPPPPADVATGPTIYSNVGD